MSRTAHKLMASSGGDTGYEIDQSLICSQADASKLRRTPSSEGNRKTFTFSTWCKRSKLGLGAGGSNFHYLFGASVTSGWSDDSHYFAFGFFHTDTLVVGGWVNNWRITNRVFRDTSAWYHIVLQFDTTQGTADNRVKIYVNGVQETSFGTSNNPSQNYDVAINNTVPQSISDCAYDAGTGPYHFDGYMAETHFFDGAVVAPSEFGETDSDTGQWIPKEYTGTASYGTNGYYMKYASGAIGTDSSGQSNNYTTTNLANSDVVLDTPTNNFPVFNYNNTGSNMTLTQGGLKTTGSGWADTFATMKVPFTGKWYWELANTTDGNGYFGIWTDNYTDTDASQDYGTGKQATSPGNLSGVSGYFSSAWSSGDIIAIAVDCDNGKLWWSKNGTWGSSGNPATGANQGLTFTATDGWNIILAGASGFVANINFGQNGTFTGTKTAQGNADGAGVGNFYYAPPSGFKALCSKNLPTPAVRPTEHFKTILYTGTGNTDYDITGVGFQPDLNWIKKRSEADNHVITDAVRGAGKVIKSEANTAEADWTDYVGPFLADGIRLNDVQQGDAVNESGQTYVMWNWKAGGGAGSSNTDGTLNTTTTSVNTAAGISMGTYTGEGGVKTVGHGLGKVPALIMLKSRSHDIDWCIYHKGAASSPEDGSLTLNDANGFDDNDNRWNDTAPTSSVFTIYSSNEVNDSGKTYVYYAFAEIEGFSKFGSYEGNNNSNGPFITTGFTPAWIVFKHTDADGEWWWMVDTTRDPYHNLVTEVLYANANSVEGGIGSGGGLDILSNGFKLKSTNGGFNGYTNTFVYMAFAEFPFKYANAR